MTVEQLVLLSEPRVRHSDGDTSRQAAQAVAPGSGSLENDILHVFTVQARNHVLVGLAGLTKGDVCGLTDDELCSFLTAYPPTIKTARSRLSKRGFLVADGVRKNSRGRDMTVWRLV